MALVVATAAVSQAAASVRAKGAKKAEAASADEVRYKENWQELWRADRKQCERDKRSIFLDSSGRLIERALHDLPKLLAEVMMENTAIGKARREAGQSVPASKSKGKVSKKERLKQQLMEQTQAQVQAVTDKLGNLEAVYQKEFKIYFEKAESTVMQISRQAKMSGKTKLTLAEFCDLIWRSGRDNPLDDKPDLPRYEDFFGEDEDEDDEDEDEVVSSGAIRPRRKEL